MPPPTPEPRITPNTTGAPSPPPSTASESAKQLASLAIFTGRPSAAVRSPRRSRPCSQVELPIEIRPLARSTEPGTPIPTVSIRPPASASSRSVSPAMARTPPS